MNEFTANLSSPFWWLSAIIVGVISSIVGAYIKSKIDNVAGRFFASWQRKRLKKEEEEQEYLVYLQNDKSEQILVATDINYFRLRSISFILFAVANLLMLGILKGDISYWWAVLIGGAGMSCILASYFDLSRAYKLKHLLELSRENAFYK